LNLLNEDGAFDGAAVEAHSPTTRRKKRRRRDKVMRRKPVVTADKVRKQRATLSEKIIAE
jgi:hypothetical protein